MANWSAERFRLPEDHGWTARPGHKVFVADRGAVLFEVPASWILTPSANCIEIRDGQPPDESCVLTVSYLRLPDRDWSVVRLSDLLLEGVKGDDRERIAQGPVIEEIRPRLQLAWTELRLIDPDERRESRSRVCVARGSNVQSLITLDFWPEDEERLSPVWEVVLSSLELGLSLDDPSRRRRPH
jgi:hypothetical protein